MYIRELKISNFKSYSSDTPALLFNIPNGNPGSGLNIFVGENNTGKSTIFEAIDFLRNGTKKDVNEIKNKNNNAVDSSIEIRFEGDIDQIISEFSQPNKVAVFRNYIFDNSRSIKLSRDTSDPKAIKLWKNDANEYRNESGIDAPVKKLFETNFVWADTNPEDEASFGASTLCGNLLKEIADGFEDSDSYREFSSVFHGTFNADESPLRQALNDIETRTRNIFRDQFGEADISFRFDQLKIESFFKNAVIEIDDGVSTPLEEKGSGMQRVVVLALLQVYADELTKNLENSDIRKPFFLFIDEPEICLHPRAQEKLLTALLEISKYKQVFLATHSPYFISTPFLQNVGLFVFKKIDGVPSVEAISNSAKLLPWSPTWGEINFKAYNLPTVEFHNELYGRLQEISGESRINEFDDWLVVENLTKSKQWTKEENGIARQPQPVTMQTFIRNKIHHPENTTMQAILYTAEELYTSIAQMIAILERKNPAINPQTIP